MLAELDVQLLIASIVDPTSQPTSGSPDYLRGLSTCDGDPAAEIILIGDLSQPEQDSWHHGDFFWPENIPSVDVSEFAYWAVRDTTPNTKSQASTIANTKEDAVNALKRNISRDVLERRAHALIDIILHPELCSRKRRAQHVILVGYGYGGLLCQHVR
ncbi:hypothetical protein O1611_g8147 [Lasiodiplodia mahajangana]|uniref:Uncharacterized protein n=1 Tax=Lasiodiplodia mahajangana TaxID=1108764 RepID=A0ACC2JDM7_9PEZI|nr:hypothetical protein O1611_g8147 [Lasiodiplodia mahajangana]